MTPDQISETMDTLTGLTEIITGFKAKLVEAGFPEDIANEMTLEFVKMIAKGGAK